MTTAIVWSRRTVTNLVVSLGAAVSLAVPVSRAAAQECAAGNTRWIHQFGTTASDETWGVAVDATGSVYVVGNTEPPSLLGHELESMDIDGLEFFGLHVWLWLDNPSGMFADFNPNTSCP